MKKMIEVTCCDGCGKEFGKNADLQKNYTELTVGANNCTVQVTITVRDRPAELCVTCLTDVCFDLEKRPF